MILKLDQVTNISIEPLTPISTRHYWSLTLSDDEREFNIIIGIYEMKYLQSEINTLIEEAGG